MVTQDNLPALLELARESIEGLGLELRSIGWPGAPGGSWEIVSTAGGQKVSIRLYGAQAVAEQPGASEEGLPVLWLSPRFSEAEARVLAARGESFADGTGRLHLNLPPIWAHLEGSRQKLAREFTEQEEAPVRVWRSAALKALFHILVEPDLVNSSQRALAQRAGVTQATIQRLFKDLEQRGQLSRHSGRKRRLIPDRPLVDEWVQGYVGRLRPRLFIGRFSFGPGRQFEDIELSGNPWSWGGDQAATRLGADLRSSHATVFTGSELLPLARHMLLRADPEGRIVIRRRFWSEPIERPIPEAVHPLIVFAELSAERSARCRAASQWIWEEYLARLF